MSVTVARTSDSGMNRPCRKSGANAGRAAPIAANTRTMRPPVGPSEASSRMIARSIVKAGISVKFRTGWSMLRMTEKIVGETTCTETA